MESMARETSTAIGSRLRSAKIVVATGTLIRRTSAMRP